MKIHYTKKHQTIQIVLGILWLVNSLLKIFFEKKQNWIGYFLLIIAIIYFIIFFYQKQKKYLTIENGIIKQNWPMGKKLKLNEITQIKRSFGNYVLKTKNSKLVINGRLIDEKSIPALESELRKYNTEWV